jgi:acetyl esterase/lipase
MGRALSCPVSTYPAQWTPAAGMIQYVMALSLRLRVVRAGAPFDRSAAPTARRTNHQYRPARSGSGHKNHRIVARVGKERSAKTGDRCVGHAAIDRRIDQYLAAQSRHFAVASQQADCWRKVPAGDVAADDKATDDSRCGHLANAARCAVVSVDYRLAVADETAPSPLDRAARCRARAKMIGNRKSIEVLQRKAAKL